MKRRAVMVRYGGAAALLVCCSVALVRKGGQNEPAARPPAERPLSSLVAPRLPVYPSRFVVPPEFLADLESQEPAPQEPVPKEPAPPREFPAAAIPPASVAPVASSGGSVPTLPIIPAGGLNTGVPVTAPTPGPLAPIPPVMAVGGAAGPTTMPVIPVPTIASTPVAPMPLAPAGLPPGPAPPAPASPAPLPIPLATPPVIPIPPTPATPIHKPAHVPIHPSKPATFPQLTITQATPVTPSSPAVLPTPVGLQTPPAILTNPPDAISPDPIVSGPGADGTPLNDYWRHGLRFESPSRDFSIFVGGRLQFDVVGYLATTTMRQNIPGTSPLEDGASFRRIRLDLGGTLYRNIDYYTQLDFANGFLATADGTRLTTSTYPTDMWVQFTDMPLLGNLRVGNQKPLYSFEHLTSSRFLNFLERSLGYDAFVENFNNGFEPGIALLNTFMNKMGTWGVGLFKNTQSPLGWNVGRNEAEVNGRVTFLPVYAENGKYLLHLGVGAAYRDLDQDQTRFRARLDARNNPSTFSPLIADTGLLFGEKQHLLIPELVMVAGPWSFQSEYYASWVEGAAPLGPAGQPLGPRGTVYMQSAYGEIHYFLTGEHREYNRDVGVFTRVVPRRPLAWSRCGFTGCGAWQVAARYSYLDLNDGGINGGRIHDMTLGLNWFLNPNMKVQWNYFLAHRNVANPAGDGFIQGFAVRTAIDF